jgi:hypothetical protein
MPKYNNITNIPAKVFFDIMKTKDYQQLKPKPKEKGLKEVYMAIYDEFFIQSDNAEAKEYLRLNTEIAFLEFKKATIKQSLAFYLYNQTTKEMRQDFIKAFKEGFGIEIDENLPFIQEVQRVLTIELGIIENDLSMAKMDFDNMVKTSKGKDFSYFESLVGIGNVLQGNSLVKEDISLAVYVELEKLAKKIVEKQNKKK